MRIIIKHYQLLALSLF